MCRTDVDVIAARAREVVRQSWIRGAVRRRLTGFAALAGFATLMIASPAAAAPLPDCATTTPAAALSPGQPATGHTVRVGEAVETFDVTILGVIEDGIAPGRDLIVVDTSGPVIDAGGGGISQGMSGSPVYTAGGDLVGAVALGFSFGPSSIGGVTPAADMLELSSEPTAARSALRPVRLSDKWRKRIARSQGIPRASVPATMRPLKLPLAVSGGLLAGHYRAVSGIGPRKAGSFVVTPGRSASSSLDPTASVAPGDSFAAALSYGDVSAAAIGTTTYVCDGKALAFGHPFMFTGRTLLGASRASIVTVVDDPAGAPFKLGFPTDPVGVVDRDRLQGIRGVLGRSIPIIPVVQTTRNLDTGLNRVGARTDVVASIGDLAGAFADIAATHALSNIDSVFNGIGGGSSAIAFTLRGTRAGGAPFTFSRSNRWISETDISIATIDELNLALLEIQDQKFEKVAFTSLDIDISIEETIRSYRIASVRWAPKGKPFKVTRSLNARPRQPIRAEVTLRASDGAPDRIVNLLFRAPRSGKDTITIFGGGELGALLGDAGFGDEGEFSVFGRARAGRGALAQSALGRNHDSFCPPVICDPTFPQSFGSLLTFLNKLPPNDTLIGSRRRSDKLVRRSLDQVVTGVRRLTVTVRSKRR